MEPPSWATAKARRDHAGQHSTANTIGGVNGLNPDGSISSLLGNVLSGNMLRGLQLTGDSSTTGRPRSRQPDRNRSRRRRQSARPNGQQGVLIDSGASNNTIGAANLDGSAANVISGNTSRGIEIQDTATSNYSWVTGLV